MAGKSFTRIYNNKKNDFIDLVDKNFDGDNTRFKKELKSESTHWKNFSSQLQADVINSEYDFPSLIEWSTKFEEFLLVNEFFPTIENLASLESMKAFDHNHTLPTHNISSKGLLNSLGYEKPDFNIITNGLSTTFSNKTIDVKIEPKEIDTREFKIVRIQSQDDNGKITFTDIKIRKFDRKQFLFDVLTLPEFWRNFHFVSRKKKNGGAIIHPAYEINKRLNYFYTPNKNFIINPIIGKNKKEIFENVKSNMPLNLTINSFATHLFFSQPGLILPLTACEQAWSKNKTPEMTISLNENEVTLITIDYSKKSSENKQVLEEFSESFSEREQSFAKFFDLGQYSGGQYLLTTGDEFAFVYETNMIELFDSLSKLDKHTNT